MAEPTIELALAPNPLGDVVRAGLSLQIEDVLGVGKLQIWGEDPLATFASIVSHAAPEPRRQDEAGGLEFAWLAPGEWLILGTQPAVIYVIERLNEEGGDTVLALDITHARSSMILSGPDSRAALAAHCPLDLNDAMFPVGAVARTLLGDTRLFIARRPDSAGDPQFRIIVDQTMGTYAVRLLAGAKSFGA